MRGQSLYLREVLAAASGAHPLLVYKGRCSTRLLAVNAEFFLYLMALRKLNFVVAYHMQQLNHTERLSRTRAFTTLHSRIVNSSFATTKFIPNGEKGKQNTQYKYKKTHGNTTNI